MEIGDFGRLFLGIAETLEAGIPGAMEEVGRIVQEEAKSMIGTYQTGISPYRDWAQLSPYTQDDRAARGYPPNEPLLREGDLRDSIEHDAGPFEAVVGSDDRVAVYQELGTEAQRQGQGPPGIPPRSFLGGAAVRKADEIVALMWGAFSAPLTQTWFQRVHHWSPRIR